MLKIMTVRICPAFSWLIVITNSNAQIQEITSGQLEYVHTVPRIKAAENITEVILTPLRLCAGSILFKREINNV